MANAYQLISIEQVDGLAAALEAAGTPSAAEILASLLTVDGSGSGLNADLFDGYNSTDFVLTSAYTAADVLSKLLTVDGASSTLDADLLDGQHGSYYNAWGNLTGAPEYAQAATSASLSLRDTGGTRRVFLYGDSDGQGFLNTTLGGYIFRATAGNPAFTISGNVFINGNGIWHAGNDGAGSALDADLLDGQEGSYYQNAGNLNAGTILAARMPALTGDITTTAGAVATTLATVNGNVGSFGSSTAAAIFTVNAKGLITAASSATITPAWSSITSKPTTLAGYGITDLIAKTDTANVFTEIQTISGVVPGIKFIETDQTAPIGGWTINLNSGSFYIRHNTASPVNFATQNIVMDISNAEVVTFANTPSAFGNAIWHAGNDGASSGLDADLLDGQQGSYYQNAGNLNAGTILAARMPALTGDITTSAGAVATTLATVNVNVGSFGSATAAATFTVNAKGLITTAGSTTITPAWGSVTSVPAGVTSLAALTGAGVVTATSTGVLAMRSIGVAGSTEIPDRAAADSRYLTLSGGTLAGYLTLHADPASSMQAATKQYVDTVASGLSPKAACRVSTTVAGGNITLSGTQTIDGVAVVAGNRVLVKNQTSSLQNGIYVCAAGAWSRATDADSWAELVSAFVFIEEGTDLADTGWTCTVNSGGTLGVTAVTWVQFSGSATFTASTGITKSGVDFQLTGQALALHNLATNGSIHRTGSGTYASRTLTAPAAGITVTNGDGVAGNPTLVLANDLAGVEGLATTGIVRRTATDTWSASALVNADLPTSGVTAATYRSVTVNAQGIITGGTNPTTISGYGITDAAAIAAFTSPTKSLSAIDSRAITNPTTGIGYSGGGRFRFSSLNDDSLTPYADVIDLSTYTDASGGGFNSLYFSKSTQTILHKWAAAAGTSWTAKTIAYTDSSITGSAATLTTGRTIAITGDLTWTSPSFNGSTNITAAGTLATVNGNVGSFGSATAAAIFTVNAKGLITAASSATITPAWSSITSKPTTISGYGITDAALINATNTFTAGQIISTGAATSSLRLDSAAGQYRWLEMATAGTRRWLIYATNSAESGSNAGSDFVIGAYNDAGSGLNSPIVITRSTGAVTLAVTPFVGGSAMWHAGNDGAGSTLDADLLDGQHGSYYQNAGNLNAGTLLAARMPALTGDITTTAGAVATTLATVNGNIGSFGSATAAPTFTVNAKGLITAAGSATITPAWSSITSKPTTISGFGITNAVPQQDGSRTNLDFNTQLTSGFYNTDNAPTNGPSAHAYGQLIVAKGIDTGLQIAGGYNNALYFRGWHSSGTFYAWQKVWTDNNDGASSGLDADLLDGQQGSFYQSASNINAGTLGLSYVPSQLVRSGGTGGTDWNDASSILNGFSGLLLGTATNGPGGGVYYHPWTIEYSTSGNVTQFAIPYSDASAIPTGLRYRGRYAGSWTSWHTIWSSGNDGTGSGLDADLLDGLDSTQFARLGTTSTFTTQQVISSQVAANDWTNYGLQIREVGLVGAAQSSGSYDPSISFHWSGRDVNRLHMNASGVLMWGLGTIWNSTNDGSGSGLDADLLDGLNSSVTSVASTIAARDASSQLTAHSFHVAASPGLGIRFWESSDYSIYMSDAANATWGGRVISETTSDYNMYFKMNSGTNRGFVFENGTTSVAGIDGSGNIRSAAALRSVNGLASIGSTSGSTHATRYVNPGGGSRTISTSSETGAIKIRLPNLHSNAMFRMRVEIYNYSAGQSETFVISGYPYSATWANCSAEQYTDSNATKKSVRFGNDGTYNCVWIGELAQTWSYPQVFITEFNHGYSGYSSDFSSGWNISFVTAFDTVQITRDAAYHWNATNDGAGSGLNADLLDGYDSSQSSDTVNTVAVRDGSGYLNQRVIRNAVGGTTDGMYIGYGNAASGSTRIYGGGSTTTNLTVQATSMTAPGEVYTPSGSYFRAQGTGGFYCETYNGGWNMTDGTWLRSIADKGILTGGAIQGATVTATSDRRLKTEIQPLTGFGDVIDQTNVYSFIKDGTRQWGVIAQEVLETPAALLVHEGGTIHEEDGDAILTVDFAGFTYALLAEVKELRKRVAAMEARQ